MGALRLILLGAGLLFLALLAWIGSRRPRRVQADDSRGEARNEPRNESWSEPGLDEAAVSAWPGSQSSAAESMGPMSAATPVVPGMGVDPPVIEWRDVQVDDGADGAVHGEAGDRNADGRAMIEDIPVLTATPERRGPPRGSGSAAANAPAATPPGVEPDLIVAWPPEPERFIASLRILPARSERLSGRLLRQGLAASGFRHGPFGIFHVGHDDGRVLISAASLVRPGVLDPANMDFHHFPGVNLFAVLPAPVEPPLLLERMCSLAFELAERIEGVVQDESGAPFDPQESPAWRARCIAALAQREPPAGAH